MTKTLTHDLKPGDPVGFVSHKTDEWTVGTFQRFVPGPESAEVWVGDEPYGFYAPADLTVLRRCECCDGPDGFGFYHVRGDYALRRFVRQHTGSMAIAYETGSGRSIAEFDSVADAEAWLDASDAEDPR